MLIRSSVIAAWARIRRCGGGPVVVAILCTLLFGWLAIEASAPRVLAISRTVRALAQAERAPSLEHSAQWLSEAGSAYVLVPLNVGLLGFFLLHGDGWALRVPLLTAGSILVVGLGRTLAWGTAAMSSGFPDWRVTASVVFFGAFAYLFWTEDLAPVWRRFASTLAILVMLGVSCSSVYLNAYGLRDTLGGLSGGVAYLEFGIIWMERHR